MQVLMWVVVGCGPGGPLGIPRGVDVAVTLPSDCDDRNNVTSEDDQLFVGEIVNTSDDPRLVELVDPVFEEEAIEADGLVRPGGSMLDVTTVDGERNDRGDHAALGGGEIAGIEIYGKAYCFEADGWPKPGRYRRELMITSTDLLGGDLVEQPIAVTVKVEQ